MQSIAEVWKDIQGYEGLYQVSNFGRVKSLGRYKKSPLLKSGYFWASEKFLKLSKRVDGYLNVRLSKNGKCKNFKVHRLVAIAFIPNSKNLPQIDHIDADKTNNNVNNLRWCTCKENINNPLTIAVHSIANIGKKLSEETKEKISARLSGRKLSEETREKIRKNRPNSRKVRNIKTKEIFNTVTDASIKYNVSQSAIVQAIKNNGKCSGCKWEYVNASIAQRNRISKKI